MRWAIENGLGSLLRKATAQDPAARTSPLWPLVLGADLTARVLSADRIDAMAEIIDACQQLPTLTLLKGISLCQEYYPETHLRPMRDVDFLVDSLAVPAVEALLVKLGYQQQFKNPPEFYEKHHHTAPFLHRGRGVWVEVHRGLFPPTSRCSADWVFMQDNLEAQLRAAEFRGRAVNRLSPELELVYLASHWASEHRVHGGIIPLLDVIYLLRKVHDIRWAQLLEWVTRTAAAGHLYLLLSYLLEYRLVDVSPDVLADLWTRQRAFGRLNLAVLHRLIDRYMVDGSGFGFLVRPGNYGVTWQTLLRPDSPWRNLVRLPFAVVGPHLALMTRRLSE